MTSFPKSKLLFLPISYKLFGQLNRFFFFAFAQVYFQKHNCAWSYQILMLLHLPDWQNNKTFIYLYFGYRKKKHYTFHNNITLFKINQMMPFIFLSKWHRGNTFKDTCRDVQTRILLWFIILFQFYPKLPETVIWEG